MEEYAFHIDLSTGSLGFLESFWYFSSIRLFSFQFNNNSILLRLTINIQVMSKYQWRFHKHMLRHPFYSFNPQCELIKKQTCSQFHYYCHSFDNCIQIKSTAEMTAVSIEPNIIEHAPQCYKSSYRRLYRETSVNAQRIISNSFGICNKG